MKKIGTLLIALAIIVLPLSTRAGGNDPGLSINSINSYQYKTAVGVRAFGTSGISIKHFHRKNSAIEGILGVWPHAFSATVLLERTTTAFGEVGLNWYYGIGGHMATSAEIVDPRERVASREAGDVALGVDGIFGLEYKIHEIPIAVSLDVKPFVEVNTSGTAFVALDPGFGIKLTF